MLERLTRNWPLKLLALGLAFAVWVSVTGESRIVVGFRVPVEVVLPSDRLLRHPAPPTIGVELRGPETILRGVDSTDLALRVDLRDTGPGARTVQPAGSDVKGLPRGIDIVQFDPAQLTFDVVARSRRSLPVAPSFVDDPPAGYALYGAQVVPETVEVEGPESEVASQSRLRTDPIHLEGRTRSFTAEVGVVSDNPAVRVVDPRPLEVRAFVDAAPVEVTIEDVPVVLAGQVPAASPVPSSVRVTLSGPPAVLAGIVPSRIRAVADVSGLTPRAEPYHLPLRTEILRVTPDELARITVKSISSPTITIVLSERRAPR
jgi:YbbR domain-containing protein